LKQHDGTWLDITKERDTFRKARLKIGAYPNAESQIEIYRCTPNHLLDTLDKITHKNLMPFILADATCPEGASPAPLNCVEDLGGDADHSPAATPATTVHLAFAAVEKQRKRDVQAIFRSAIREALLTYKYFTLVFGDSFRFSDDSGPGWGNTEGIDGLPKTWGLSEFLDPYALPLDLFDLHHFLTSGAVNSFLPQDKVRSTTVILPVPGTGVEDAVEKKSEPAVSRQGSKENVVMPITPPLPPPIAYSLQFALVSTWRIEADASDTQVREHLSRRFGSHVPLHRIVAVVVIGEKEG